MEFVTLAPMVLGALPWRDPSGLRRLTVVAKGTFELRHREPARLIEPYPLFEDAYHEGNEGRSLRLASDHVPRKARADVLVMASVYAPVGQRVTQREARFALLSRERPVIDKRIVAVGRRERVNGGTSPPTPFPHLPMRYELAFGGSSSPWNPVGVGADPGDPRLPWFVLPGDPRAVAGLGPVPSHWGWRSRTLAGAVPPSATQGMLTVPAPFDFGYFNAAPPDQQVSELRGDETVLLASLHPTAGEVLASLPARHASARVELRGRGREVPMTLDTLWIEADTLRCTLTWRGSVELDAADADAMGSARVVAAFRDEGSARTSEPAAGLPAAAPQEPSTTSAHASPPGAGTTSALRNQRVAPKRTTPQVPLVTSTGMQVWTLPWQVRPPEHSLTVIVKGTFVLGAGGALELSPDQDPPSGDVPWDAEPPPSEYGPDLRYASDFVYFKPAADILLVGHAHSGMQPSGVALVELRIGSLRRRLAVFGDRKWGSETSPAPFDRMPLRWERALGGALSDTNPAGRGYKTGLLLPNIERPETLVRSKGDTPAPACFAPLAPMWKPRRSKLGTYDATWLKTRWPYFPADFDWRHFNAAPVEQQVPYLEGNEAFSVAGVRPGGGAIEGRLPGLRPRAFVQRTSEAGGEFFEVLLRLDTFWMDADAGKVVLLWRGLFTVADEDAPDVAALHVDVEPPGMSRSLEQAQERLFAVLAAGEILPAAALGFPDEPPRGDGGGGRPSAPAPPTAEQILSMLAAGKALAGLDLSGSNLAGLDLSAADLSGALMGRAALSGAKLAGAKLRGAMLAGAVAEGTNLDGADLTDADLTGANLARATFVGADLTNATLDRAKASGADFTKAKGRGTTFVHAVLDGARFDGASLLQADLSAASFDRASFRGAQLDDVRLLDARGEGASFEGAAMPEARAQGVALPRGILTSVAAPRSSWESADLAGATLQDAKLDGAIFTRAKLEGTNLNRASAREASFRGANMKGARCLKANLMQAVFERADLREADLRGANLYQAETWRARMDRADLSLAHTAETKLAR